jgi:hypothetical protein
MRAEDQVTKAISSIFDTQDPQLPKILALIVIDDPTMYQTLKIGGSMTVNIAKELVDILGWNGAAAIIGFNNMMPELSFEKEIHLQTKKEELSAKINEQKKAQTVTGSSQRINVNAKTS